MTFAFILMIILGAICIGCTIYTIKQQKQKDYDTENYNQQLQAENKILEEQVQRLRNECARGATELRLIEQEKSTLLKDQTVLEAIVKGLQEEQIELSHKRELAFKDLTHAQKQQKELEAQMSTLNRIIEETTSSQKELARASFVSYCDALDNDYKEKEEEYDGLMVFLQTIYDQQADKLQQAFVKEKRFYEEDLEVIRQELEKLRATRAAALEAQLRELEVQDKAAFYTLQLSEADKHDVAYLQSIEYNLREARPLRMLIWSTFYREQLNSLAARVGAVGACGIYKITHIQSGISYIGQARDIKERWVTHVKCSLGIDTPATSKLYTFTRQEGIDNFTFEVLEKCSQEELNEKEKFYIDLYQTYDFGLNATKGNK